MLDLIACFLSEHDLIACRIAIGSRATRIARRGTRIKTRGAIVIAERIFFCVEI
jgi:hypothetical protein